MARRHPGLLRAAGLTACFLSGCLFYANNPRQPAVKDLPTSLAAAGPADPPPPDSTPPPPPPPSPQLARASDYHPRLPATSVSKGARPPGPEQTVAAKGTD